MKATAISESFLPDDLSINDIRTMLDNKSNIDAFLITRDGIFWAATNAKHPPAIPSPDEADIPLSLSSDPFDNTQREKK